jgi:hypothetical protein
MKRTLAIAAISLCMAGLAFADSDRVDCHAPENAKLKNDAKNNYEAMLANDKAGKYKATYDAARNIDPYCISKQGPEIERIESQQAAVLKRTSKQLGDAAESQGKFTEAYDYYVYFHGIDADRAKFKLATAKPDDLRAVQAGVYYFRNMRDTLGKEAAPPESPGDLDKARLGVMMHYMSQESVDAMDPERTARLQVVNDHLGKLEVLATRNGDKFLASEETVFAARKTSLTAKINSLAELDTARNWFKLAELEARANDRAIMRGDSLLKEDARRSLELAIDYYHFAGDEAKTAAVKDKARRLGDSHLQMGDKKMASEYYDIAGLHDKAIGLSSAHETEKENAEAKRREQFKQEQKSLEEELGF